MVSSSMNRPSISRPGPSGGGVGGLGGGLFPGRRLGIVGGTGRGGGLVDPAADAVDEVLAAGGLGVTHARHDPEFLGLPGRHVQLARVLGLSLLIWPGWPKKRNSHC